MTALLLKDFYNLKKQLRIMLMFSVLYGILSIFTANIAFLVGILCVLCLMLPISSFSFDQFSKWDDYALALPITRKQIVISKYLLTLVSLITAALLCTVTQFTYTLIVKADTFDGNYFSFLLGLLSTCILLSSINLPITIKFGPEKARVATIFIFLAPVIVAAVAAKVGMPAPDAAALEMAVLLLPVLAIMSFIASFMISIKLYDRKDL